MTIPKQSVRHIKLNCLVGHEHNRKLDPESLRELADSIREHGILQPLVVTEHPTEDDRWIILGGHRRASAARQVGHSAVPCVIRHNLDDTDEQLVVMLVENCQRKDLNAVEKAEAFGVLRRRGLSLNEIARRTGLAEGTVSYYVSLLDLDAETRERVRRGEVQVSQATDAVKAARKSLRAAKGTGQPGRKVHLEAAHFTPDHPLARAVRDTCDHTARPWVGQVGCGQCWELVIRTDVSQRPTVRKSS